VSRPAIFLDRDGTINVDVHHLHRADDLQLIPKAGDAIARLNAAGYPVIVITNQSAVARGLLTKSELNTINNKLRDLLNPFNATITDIYFCPHHPEHGDRIACDCRKPQPGMLQRAAREHDLDLTRSIMVGDNLSDLQAGRNAGCSSALVRTGYGQTVEQSLDPKIRTRIAYIGDDLADIVDWILTTAGASLN
jgi:D-glycero-D-manno-heptose 1,7-bisphosphate phosphatase